MTAPFRVEVLGEHDRSTFSCGVAALDRYFRSQVTQDIRRRIANCFVVVECGTKSLAGFYTLAMAGVVMTELPPELVRRLPRYPSLPAARVGRLAVAEPFRNRGLGGAMLADAAHRILESSAAAHALIVDAKDEAAARFYEHHGFQRFQSRPTSLFLPLETARKALPGKA